MEPAQAAAEAARRRVKRAAGLLKEAGRDLAALADGDTTVLGSLRVHDTETAEAARELIALGAGRHGAVDVVVIARPTGRKPTHHGPNGAKETHNGTQRNNEEDADRAGRRAPRG